jgi:hypothetical protein
MSRTKLLCARVASEPRQPKPQLANRMTRPSPGSSANYDATISTPVKPLFGHRERGGEEGECTGRERATRSPATGRKKRGGGCDSEERPEKARVHPHRSVVWWATGGYVESGRPGVVQPASQAEHLHRSARSGPDPLKATKILFHENPLPIPLLMDEIVAKDRRTTELLPRMRGELGGAKLRDPPASKINGWPG